MVATTVKATKVKGATGRIQRECPLCGSAELDYEFIVENCPLCCCRECSLTFLNPQPEEFGGMGPKPLESGDGVYEIHAANAAARLGQFIAYGGISAGRLLLVGAGESLQDEAVRGGFEVVSLSPAELEEFAPEGGTGLFDGCILYCALERTSDRIAGSFQCEIGRHT